MRAGRVICASILSFGSVCALPWILKTGSDALSFTNSILSVFVFLGLAIFYYMILCNSFTGNRKRWILPGVFGFFFSLCMVIGTCLDEKESVPFDNLGMWAAIFTFGIGWRSGRKREETFLSGERKACQGRGS